MAGKAGPIREATRIRKPKMMLKQGKNADPSDAALIPRKGEYFVRTLDLVHPDTDEVRVVVNMEHELQEADLRRVVVTIMEKIASAAAPTNLDFYIVGTDEHFNLITITGTTDGSYDVTINQTVFSFVASSDTAEAIRDGLVAAINGGTEPVYADINNPAGGALPTNQLIVRNFSEAEITDPDDQLGALPNTGYSIGVNGPGVPDITNLTIRGSKDFLDNWYTNTTNALAGLGTVPEEPIDDRPVEPIPHVLKNDVNGRVQLVFILTGASDNTDYTIIVQAQGDEVAA